MEEKEKKKKNPYLRMVFPTVVFVIFVLIVIWSHVYKLNELSRKTLFSQITLQTEVYCALLQQELVNLDKTAEPVVEAMEQGLAFEEQALILLKENSRASRVAVLDDQGRGKDSEGQSVSIDPSVYLGTLKRGMSTYYYCEQDCITMLTPVVMEDRITYILMMEYRVSNFDELFANFNLGKDAWLILTDGDGNTVYCFSKASDDHIKAGENFFETLSNAQSGRVITMMDEISRSQESYKEIDLGEDVRQIFYQPLGIDQWYIFVGVTDSYIDTRLSKEQSTVRQMVEWLMAAVALFIVMIVIVNIKDKLRDRTKNEGLVQLAETDQLTGLYNKVTTENKIREFMEENPDTQSLLFVLDIDNFKKINDTLGHAFGDEVLRTIGQRIRMEFRASDIIGRAGGDEFIILLKNLNSDEIIIREAQKVEQFFKSFEAGTYVKYAATASIGCAVFPRDAGDFEGLYRAADQALYQAKKRGKNQLAFYKEPEGFGQSV